MPEPNVIALHSLPNLPSPDKVLNRSDHFTPVKSKDGKDVLVCGTCHLKLAENVVKERMRYTFLACPRCYAMNEMPE